MKILRLTPKEYEELLSVIEKGLSDNEEYEEYIRQRFGANLGEAYKIEVVYDDCYIPKFSKDLHRINPAVTRWMQACVSTH